MKIIDTFPENPTEADKRQLAAFVRFKKQAAELVPEEKEKFQEQAAEGRVLLHAHHGSTAK